MWVVVDRGFSRETVVACEIKDCDVAGEITCIECEGTGIIDLRPFQDVCDCVECKGAGRIFVSF